MKRKKTKVECMTKPDWLELPKGLMKNILQRLDTVEIVTSARNVCPLWWKVCKDPQMWRTIHMINDVSPFDFRCLERICRCAIDLSCGHLEDIAIESFGTDELLEYMANRATHLRRLQIFGNTGISDKGLGEFVKKFSLLEKLEISHCSKSFSKDILEVIGQCCPLLKSLNLEWLSDLPTSDDKSVYSYIKGDEAFGIAKTMSGLRHLKLHGYFLDYDGLLAILDGCPLLESLDLRGCIYHCSNSNPSLLKRCSEQIKDFQHPFVL